jgi:hypothetical protein
MTGRLRGKSWALLAFAVLCSMVGVIQLSEWLAGQMIASGDVAWHSELILKHYFAGKGLWYDACLNGLSLLGNPTYQLFYLPSQLYGLLSFDAAARVVYLLHYPLFGLAAWIWADRLRLPTGPALLATLLLMSSGLILGMAMRGPLYFYPLPWLMLASALTMDLVRTRRLRYGAAVGAAVAIANLSGDFFAVAYGLFPVLGSAWAAYAERPAAGREPLREARNLLAGAAIAAVVFAAFAGFTVYHAYAMARLHERAREGLSPEMVLAHSFHPYQAVEFFWHYFGSYFDFKGFEYGNSPDGTKAGWWYPILYFGPASALLLPFAAAAGVRERRLRGLGLAVAVMLFVSVGIWNPLVAAAVRAAPGWMRIARYPAKLVLPAAVTALPLFAVGARDAWALVARRIRASEQRRLVAAVAVAALLLPPLFAVTDALWLIPEVRGARPDLLRALPAEQADQRRFHVVLGPAPMKRVGTGTQAELVDALLAANGPVYWGERQYICNDSTISKFEWNEAGAVADRAGREVFGVTHLVINGALAPEMAAAVAKGELREVARSASGDAVLLADPEPIARVVGLARWVELDPESTSEPPPMSLREGHALVHPTVFLDGDGDLVRGVPPAAPSPSDPTCRLAVEGRLEPTSTAVSTLKTQGPCGGLVVVNARFVAGWRARLDGEPVAIRRVDELMLGIPVPAGEHTVTLEFAPAHLAPFVPATLALQACALLGLAWLVRRSLRDGAETAGEPMPSA